MLKTEDNLRGNVIPPFPRPVSHGTCYDGGTANRRTLRTIREGWTGSALFPAAQDIMI